MEYLRGTGWVKGKALPPGTLAGILLKKGWIEQQLQGLDQDVFYRMTDLGLAAMKAPVPIQKSWAKPKNVGAGELGLTAKPK
ncbi:MAG: hypothetical protein ABI561_20720 [Bradyrhizobium sp.]